MGLNNSLTYDTMDADLRMRQRLRQKQGSPVVTGVQQVPLNSAGWPCTRSAGAPAPAGGQKSASVLTLVREPHGVVTDVHGGVGGDSDVQALI